MNLHDEENRLALQTWVSDLRASVQQFGNKTSIPLPVNPDEARARLKQESESNGPAIKRAISHFSREMRWPDDLTNSQYYHINLRALAAYRLIDLLLSGEVTNPGIVEVVGSDKADFTKWMLTTAWDTFGESYLETIFPTLFRQ